MTSSIFALTLDPKTTATANEDLLNSDISISREQVRPGGGAILRLYFTFNFISSTSTVSVFNNDLYEGNLNADNSSEVVSNGYYRFDIGVEEGDSINLQASNDITSLVFLRAHLVQFGA